MVGWEVKNGEVGIERLSRAIKGMFSRGSVERGIREGRGKKVMDWKGRGSRVSKGWCKKRNEERGIRGERRKEVRDWEVKGSEGWRNSGREG